MAAVIDAFAPYIKKLFADMAQEEVSMLLGVSGEITKLEDNMETLKVFLADAEMRRLTDQSVQQWVRKLKGAMYDATDIIDDCQLEADKRRKSRSKNLEQNSIAGCIHPLLFCMRNPVFAHKIGSRIKKLNERLERIHEEAERFKFNIGLGSNPEPRKLSAAERSSLKMTSEFDDSAIVGEKIETDTRELARLLITSGSHEIKVVSIVGTGGMGKTTLAQKVFNDTIVQQRFKLKIWLSITQHFDEGELLRTAIKHAGGHHDGEKDKTLLTRTLTETLSMGKFLLILDDVWGDEAWKNVLSVPTKKAGQKQPGNWVLITTRREDLAQRMGASFYQHHISLLDEEDAWALLNKQLPPSANQVRGAEHLKDVGMKIVRKCGGLPLAVKVMGGLLSTRSRSEHEWEAVLNHHAWSLVGLPKELDNRIYLSYNDLSPQLKQCFLYCSLFPKGTTILQSIIVPMWISEGFIQPQYGSSSNDDGLEEIATEYYHELITRNLIEPTREFSLTGYKCTMHDVVRSFAEFMAKEDSLVLQDMQVAGRGYSDSIVRRMSIGPSKLVPEWAFLQKQESIQTLIIKCKINFEPSDSLTSFSRLRVLSIKGGDCDILIGSLCHLRHLRYLSLEKTNISRLPDNIHRMKFLQHIILGWSMNLESLPRTIIDLLHLRTLNIYGSNVNVVIPRGFGRLTNLRTLFGFPVHKDMDGDRGWCSLKELGPLSQLRMLTLHGLENVDVGSFSEMAMINSKEHIDYLELNWNSSKCMGFIKEEIKKQQQQQVVEEVFEKLCPTPCIRHLVVKGYFGCQLPNWMKVHDTLTFKSLRFLMFKDLSFCTQLPVGLCQLHSLEGLEIINAPAIRRVGPEFQSPSSLALGGGGTICASSIASFPSLTNLHLEGLCEWEEWVWEEQNKDGTADTMDMPALSTLRIGNCKLRLLPPGLASSKRHTLRKLKLYELTNLISVENFPSIVQLDLFDCPKLKSISGLSGLQKIRIFRCGNVEVLQGVPSLDSMQMKDGTMETLPEYLTTVKPRCLKMLCNKKLYESLLTCGSSEYKKIIHIKSRTIDYINEDED